MNYRFYGCVIALLFSVVTWIAMYRLFEWARQ
jgi:hypothetical protein